MPTESAAARTRAPLAPKSKYGNKRDRFQARMSAVQRDILQEAAEIEGRTMSDYVLTHAQMAAERTIRNHRTTQVSAQYAQAFAEVTLNPPQPNARMREAAEFFNAVMGDR